MNVEMRLSGYVRDSRSPFEIVPTDQDVGRDSWPDIGNACKFSKFEP